MSDRSDANEGTAAQPTAPGIDAVVEEVRSTRMTAEQMATDGPSPGADVPRVLAGLVSHLAEQVEKLALLSPSQAAGSPSGTAAGGQARPSGPAVTDGTDADEEDISPEDAPAAPRRDPDADGSDRP